MKIRSKHLEQCSRHSKQLFLMLMLGAQELLLLLCSRNTPWRQGGDICSPGDRDLVSHMKSISSTHWTMGQIHKYSILTFKEFSSLCIAWTLFLLSFHCTGNTFSKIYTASFDFMKPTVIPQILWKSTVRFIMIWIVCYCSCTDVLKE